ncbi:hypothetical protein INN71_07670 [Nocardioides sp. ChNu-153]|nr:MULTISPECIES: hypothetical protein [unclassified Nocardioides]MDF9715597.1 hypothetical protein [Nocardioides sp. ChNu-99]MDN7121269.1 hypothetical protein [Nocardioides sp. ChNu-153]
MTIALIALALLILLAVALGRTVAHDRGCAPRSHPADVFDPTGPGRWR